MSNPLAPSTRKSSLRSPTSTLEHAHPLSAILKCDPPLVPRLSPSRPGHVGQATVSSPKIPRTATSSRTDETIVVNGYHVGTSGNQQLYRADLFGADLRLIDFRDADLRFANLRGCDFTRADLTGADLLGAHLADANFFLAKVSLPSGWEIVDGRARKKNNWSFDQKGRGFFQDRDCEAKRLESLITDNLEAPLVERSPGVLLDVRYARCVVQVR